MSDLTENKIHLSLSPDQVEETVADLAEQISRSVDDRETAFVGIFTRGVTLADRVAELVNRKNGNEIPVGALDVSLYRDDLDNMGSDLPRLKSSRVPFSLEGTRVILFDDVLYTGRTIRAALDELSDFGRPSKVELAVLVDRGWREFPIQPDYTGYLFETEKGDHVRVKFQENDGEEGVFLTRQKPGDL